MVILEIKLAIFAEQLLSVVLNFNFLANQYLSSALFFFYNT